MSDLQAIADRIEIEALRGEFVDAIMTRDYDRFASLFTQDGAWRIPYINAGLVGREEIRAGIERMQGLWEYFVQNTHPGTIQLQGDTAVGRAHISEFGRMRDGRSELNYSIYHDRYQRTPDGWRFTERVYEIRYLDTTPLAGAPLGDDTREPAQPDQHAQPSIDELSPFIGTWSVEARLPEGPPLDLRGRQEFERMPGGGFVIQRWEAPDTAPNPHGVALIGVQPGRDTYLQHYFDCRGLARVYEMSLADGVWKLWRNAADFSPLDFQQRFTGTFSPDGNAIVGRWEKSGDGVHWERDLDLIYTKVG